MHELGIIQEVFRIVDIKMPDRAVEKITLEVGALSCVLPKSLTFCFDICKEGTKYEQTELEVLSLPGVARCLNCDKMNELLKPFGRCECGETEFDWLSGEELKIKNVEVL